MKWNAQWFWLCKSDMTHAYIDCILYIKTSLGKEKEIQFQNNDISLTLSANIWPSKRAQSLCIYGPHNVEAMGKIWVILYPGSQTFFVSCATEKLSWEWMGSLLQSYPGFPLIIPWFRVAVYMVLILLRDSSHSGTVLPNLCHHISRPQNH